MNNKESAILEYAKFCKEFNRHEVFVYLSSKMSVSEASLSWCLNSLLKKGSLVRVGHGRYAMASKSTFVPSPSVEIIEIYSLLHENFPFANFCIYAGNIVSSLQHHLSPNNIVYIETNREAVETIFNFLRGRDKNVYLKPDKNFIYHYVDLEKEAFFIKPLVSESPIQIVNAIPMPTIEKILVDIYKDKDFFYLQGLENNHIFQNAFSLYAINKSKLLRYAGRRGVRDEINLHINLLNSYD